MGDNPYIPTADEMAKITRLKGQNNLGVKYDDDKPRFDLIPPTALLELAILYQNGAKKYGDRNWEKGIAFSRLVAAIERHLNAFLLGEIRDPEILCLHTTAIAWNAFALSHFMLTGRRLELNDLPSYSMLTKEAIIKQSLQAKKVGETSSSPDTEKIK